MPSGLSLDNGAPLVLNQRKTAVPPAITATCKQIRNETLHMFYHGRTVVLDLPSLNPPKASWSPIALSNIICDTAKWLASVPESCHRLIEAFEVRDTCALKGSTADIRRFCDDGTNYFHACEASLPELVALLGRYGYCGARRPLFAYTRITIPRGSTRGVEVWRTAMARLGFRFFGVVIRPPAIVTAEYEIEYDFDILSYMSRGAHGAYHVSPWPVIVLAYKLLTLI